MVEGLFRQDAISVGNAETYLSEFFRNHSQCSRVTRVRESSFEA